MDFLLYTKFLMYWIFVKFVTENEVRMEEYWIDLFYYRCYII